MTNKTKRLEIKLGAGISVPKYQQLLARLRVDENQRRCI